MNTSGVFWSNQGDGRVMRIGLSGGSATTLFPGPGASWDLTVDAAKVYWSDASAGSVRSIAIAGGTVTTLASGQTNVVSVRVDASYVYWSRQNTSGALSRTPLGAGAITTLASSLNVPGGIAADGTSLFWAQGDGSGGDGKVMKMPAAGGAATMLSVGTGNAWGIALDATNVYWTDSLNGKISRVPIAGGTTTTIASGLTQPQGIAVDASGVYWVSGTMAGAVMMLPATGGAPRTLAVGQPGPWKIATDATSVYWTNYAQGTVMKVAKPDPAATWLPPPSCVASGDGATNCGTAGNESCCPSPLISGGTFSRSYDGVTTGYTDPQYKATVSDFRLDKYEVTVGRFRQFVNAVVAGWKPASGTGKHVHLSGGNGLAASGGGFEPGWDATNWNSQLATSLTTWGDTTHLGANPPYPTWTGGNERRPINNLTWYEAEAFCIWDGGFLPSEAEWNAAAVGEAEQRSYPWGATAPGPNASLGIYGCYFGGTGTCTGVGNIAPVGTVPAGNGKYGQADLGGSVTEWVLDWFRAPYNETSCLNCAYATSASSRSARGGGFGSVPSTMFAPARYDAPPTLRHSDVGARCARSP